MSIRKLPDGRSAACGATQVSPSASCANGAASSSPGETRGRRSAATDAGRIYVETVIDLYLWLPGTPTRTSRHDRRLARTLYERDVGLAVVRAALLLGACRRAFRPADAWPLPPIRTLHFFLPLIDEIIEDPLAPDYVEYIENKLDPLAYAKAEKG